jgi:hypothetical protein
LEWKVALFVVAAGLGLGGMYLEEGWLTAGAILLLLAGVLLRFPAKPVHDDEAGEDEDDGDPDGDLGHHEASPR